ncbi:glycosyl transferase family 1 [Betaproteobacteria bacterium SCGC AG-212-J23]|nr:glycosyl transferase family 1 [Betaproteobacteria bacterium SCGC AG-212-J23]
MRIVHTESSLGWGGQEIRILSESQGLARRGHEIRLLCPPEARIFAEAPSWGLQPEAVPIARKSWNGFVSLKKKFQGCDVISTHSSTDSWLSALALRSLGRPYPMVRTRHISAPVPRNTLSTWLYTKATTRIVTAGEALKQDLVERNGFPAARIDSVPTGIDTQRFRPGDKMAARRTLGLPAEKTLIGIVATLRSWKGHRFLLEALPGEAGLVIVGDGPQRPMLEAQVAKLGIQYKVLFAGNQKDVVPWLQAFDVFALPSYANEGVPQALIQAMLAGLPCVTTNIGSMAELAIDRKTALVVAPQSVAALAAALKKLLEEKKLSQALGAAARQHCVERFGYETMLDRMEKIYREAADAHR